MKKRKLIIKRETLRVSNASIAVGGATFATCQTEAQTCACSDGCQSENYTDCWERECQIQRSEWSCGSCFGC